MTPARRVWCARGLLAVAAGCYAAAMVLKTVDYAPGWKWFPTMVEFLGYAPHGDFWLFGGLALNVNGLMVVAVPALLAGFRRGARAGAALALAVATGLVGWYMVADAYYSHSPVLGRAWSNVRFTVQYQPGTVAWFASLLALTAAGFAWPRPTHPEP